MTDEPTADDSRTDPDLTITLDLLRNERRRRVIRAIDQDGPADIGALADRITAQEHGQDFTSKQRKAVYVSLYQVHLPKLEDADVVQQGDDGLYRAGDAADEAIQTLDALEARHDAPSIRRAVAARVAALF